LRLFLNPEKSKRFMRFSTLKVAMRTDMRKLERLNHVTETMFRLART
jgi:hypothetical protein